ncbi:peptidase M13 [Corynebacterium sp. 4HC-13]|uniref:M13 family metallopeptidase n=1 Tax=Corynebacterium anserum TaxID=2684406 RepID=UPI001639AA26|nr:M13-type metalloendopeptidase [Corynebacterium anserum]MBC2682595.1 peptidase M13 [Corynebacterium anserum]
MNTTEGITPADAILNNIPDNISEAPCGQVSVAQDLYRHVNGHWLATHEIPADRAVDGTFHTLRDRAEKDVRAIVETAAKDEPQGRIGALYSSFMDERGIEDAGLSVLDADLTPIRDAKNITDLATVLGELDVRGVGGVVGYWVEKDSGGDIERAYLVQSGLGLPDEAYYREEQHKQTRDAYQQFVTRMLELTEEQERPGRFAQTSATEAAEAIMNFETRLAEGHWDQVTSRDADKTYNPTDVNHLPTGFPFRAWLEATHIDTSSAGGKIIVVCMPSYLEHVAAMATGDDAVDLDTWKLWAYWHVIISRATLLPKAIGDLNFDFYGRTLSGSEQQRARWKRGVGLVEGAIGEEIGKKFVAEHFPASYKETMLTLVDYLIDAYRERIEKLEWMTPATREKALVKLGKFTAKIGYPDKWRSFEGLEFGAQGADLLDNVRKAAEFNHDYQVSRLGKPSDPEKWFCTPQTVNAFYNPVTNDITFPAAILRPPFFDPDADMAGNFGAIGAVIGHEIGHGFDDQGSKYDGDGNLNSWWTDEDRAAFTELTDKLVAQYQGLVPTGLKQRGIEEHKVNGSFTLGENIGDLGGLGIAIVALRRYLADQGEDFQSTPALPIDGLVDNEGIADTTEYSALQRVFLRWACIWQTAIRPQMAVQYVSIDPHSPAEFRCNVVSSNIAEFYEAFSITPEDAMWLDEKDRVTIW